MCIRDSKNTLGEKLRKDKDQLYMSRQLVALKDDVRMGVTWNMLAFDSSKLG